MSEPFFSIVTPVYRTPVPYLKKLVRSVLRQGWPSWELILVDDKSDDAALTKYITTLTLKEPRVKLVTRVSNGGISAASNDGIAAAKGEFIALLDHDDLLVSGALRKIARVLKAKPEVDYLYTDEEKVDDTGRTYDVFRKPDWSPERLRGQMYTGHLSVLRTSLVREVGGFDSAFDGSQDHDLVLRVTEKAKEIYHLPEVLYRWRSHSASTAASPSNKPYTWDAGVRAVNAHLVRTGSAATAERGPVPGTYAINRPLDPETTISVVIPTRGSKGEVFGKPRTFVIEAVRSVLSNSQHERIEFVVVYDTATPADVLDELRELVGERLVLVEYDRPFNFSEKCNIGFIASSGEYIVMMNDDVQAISHAPLENLVAPLVDSTVGMTGAYLFFEDGTLQHAGHRYADRGYMHAYMTSARMGDPGPFSTLLINREVSGVTAAFAAIRREVFAELGGFSQALPSNFNDVDLSLKVLSRGYRIVWLSGVQLFHFESKTRENTVHTWEQDLVRKRWGIQRRDRYIHHPRK
ncbi:MAG: glycosyltransferase family 2 protein [Rhodoglobus sp.]